MSNSVAIGKDRRETLRKSHHVRFFLKLHPRKQVKSMRKKLWIATAGVAVVLLGLLIWKLDIPNWEHLDLDRIYAQPKSSIVCDASGNAVTALSAGQNRVWTSIDDIPEQLRNAFLAAEDQRFYEHHGISVRRILAAFVSNLRTRSYGQGASTITQQLIKLTHLSGVKTLSRKAQEAFLALQLERQLSKDEILECYLNTVYFGKGAYGVASAAQTYFSKELSELTLAESALLAGVIKAPSSYAPHINSEKSVERRNLILGKMAECDYISEHDAETASTEPLRLAMRENEEQYGWFMDAALEEAASVLNLSVDDMLSSSYTIRTAFEPVMQDAADALFDDDTRFPVGASDGTDVQAALVAMRPESGAICAVVGGRDYEVQRGLNRATQIRRSPGSAIKPVSTYAAAIDAFNLSPTSFVEDTPRDFGGGYTPGNAGGNAYGTVTLREALSRSLNIATVDLADLIGINAVSSYAAKFGLELSWQDDNLALALGSMTYGVSPAQLCAAYAALANGGMRVNPHFIERIEDADGHIVYQAEVIDDRAVQASTAYMLTDMLKTAASTGSARALSAASIPVAGKTGTVADSDGSTRDIWTAACTPDLAMTVWMGYDTPDAQHQLASSVGGSGYPARLCAAFLQEISSELACTDFIRPSGVKTALLDALALQEDEVLLATDRTPADYVVTELFHPDAMPDRFTSEWNAPAAVTDLTLLSGHGETPVLQFTVLSENAEYLLLRTSGSSTQTIAVLTGSTGEVLRYADTTADLSQRAEYAILPRHRLLYERGVQLTGKESAAVTYSPGGILDWFFGSGTNDAAPERPEIEVNEVQSIFG